MSAIQFLGDLEPWPAARDLATLRRHKSRLILQADAAHAMAAVDPMAGELAHACDRGAACWEIWILLNTDQSYVDRKACAHSAVSLARRAGDWALVGEVVEAWPRLGEGHERFYRDARAEVRDRQDALRRTSEAHNLMARRLAAGDVTVARQFLKDTEAYAVARGIASVLYFRAHALYITGDLEAARWASFAYCLAAPTSAFAASAWIARAVGTGRPPEPGPCGRALGWFDQDVLVLARAVMAGVILECESVGGRPIDALTDRLESLLDDSDAMSAKHRSVAAASVAFRRVQSGDRERAVQVLEHQLGLGGVSAVVADLHTLLTSGLLSAASALDTRRDSTGALIRDFATRYARELQEPELPALSDAA